MGGSTSEDDVIELGGREFKRVGSGLDEAQVAIYIGELISERDKLAQSQDHIASLKRLADNTVAEADRLAEEIKAEAAEQAKAQRADIIEQAKEAAQQMAEKKLAEAVEIANEMAKAIQSEAEKTAALLSENERKRTQDELSNFVNQQFSHLLEKLGSLQEQAVAAQADFNNRLFQPSAESNGAAMKESKVVAESLEPIRTTDQNDKTFELSNPVQIEDQANLGE
ncbi:hypothetical protein ACFLYR_04470 [Chloroflexota bacterium]